MYEVTIELVGIGKVIVKTAYRPAVRGIWLLAVEHPDKLKVKAIESMLPTEVKFK